RRAPGPAGLPSDARSWQRRRGEEEKPRRSAFMRYRMWEALLMTEDERAIRALVDRWMAASRAGDVATVLSLMADDAIFMVPGRAPFGKDAFRAASEGMKGARLDGRSEIEELQVFRDWAYLRNRIDITITPSGGTPMRRSGYSLSILRKGADGR